MSHPASEKDHPVGSDLASNADGRYKDANGSVAPLPLDANEERLLKKIYLKLDCYFLTVVTFIYFLNFLDRSSIGNARAAGMQTQLRLNNNEYSICLTVTYVSFLAVEYPMTMLAKRYGPNRVLPILCAVWGLIATFQGFVQNFGGLVTARFFLGAAEGAILPGSVMYISGFYRRRDIGVRMAFFFSAIALAGAFSGLLAAAIVQLDGTGGHAGWRFIFWLEGAFTVVFGVVTYFLLPRNISSTRYLTIEQRTLLLRAMALDGQHGEEDEKFSWEKSRQALTAPQALLMSIIFFCSGCLLFAIAYFAPTVVAALGYTGTRIQLMSVPPYACAFVLSLATSYISDKVKMRGPFIVGWSLIAAAGYAIYLGSTNTKVLYGSLFLQVPGVYVVAGLLGAWQSNNLFPSYKRATGIVMGFIMTNAGGILSTWLFPTTERPRYTRGTSTLLAMACTLVVFACLNVLWLSWQNRKKTAALDRGEDNEVYGEGDRRLDFKYML